MTESIESSVSTTYHTVVDDDATATTSAEPQNDSAETTRDSDEIDEDLPTNKQLSPLDAAIHIIKGNLGPGCLNLPHAFALSGWALGSGLFLLIALQGIYSMWLLLYCKKRLLQSTDPSPPRHVKTFMDVARASLGSGGAHVVEIFLFVLQGGVCCVFLSLIQTNFSAFFPGISKIVSILIVTALLMCMVLLRFIKDLLWLSATANTFMIIAIVTAAVAGIVHFFDNNSTNDNIVVANPSPSIIITFTSDMFFAFEGIGLVLPVENSYGSQKDPSYVTVLIRSMTTVASLFVLIGVSASVGFPDIHSGSVTAYLAQNYPHVAWFYIVNGMVICAVALTFPLQLTPAMEVLDGWIDRGMCARNQHHLVVDSDNSVSHTSDVTSHSGVMAEVEEPFQDEVQVSDPLASHPRDPLMEKCCCLRVWILRRWVMVLLCALIVFLIDDLSVLMALFGAVGQTGLAGMPCAIHLALQYKGVAPMSSLQTMIDVFILVFCVVVMFAGLYATIDMMV